MRQRRWYLNRGPWRYEISATFWRPTIDRWWFRSLWNWLYIDGSWPIVRAELNTSGPGLCYCPTGSTTNFYFNVFGFGMRWWIHRDRGPRPCLCSLHFAEAVPEYYEDEIRDYGGMDRVKELIEQRLAWLKAIGK